MCVCPYVRHLLLQMRLGYQQTTKKTSLEDTVLYWDDGHELEDTLLYYEYEDEFGKTK